MTGSLFDFWPRKQILIHLSCNWLKPLVTWFRLDVAHILYTLHMPVWHLIWKIWVWCFYGLSSNQHVWSSRVSLQWSMKYLYSFGKSTSTADSSFITLLLTLSKLRGLFAFLLLLSVVHVYSCREAKPSGLHNHICPHLKMRWLLLPWEPLTPG